jgi:hypothetical protein
VVFAIRCSSLAGAKGGGGAPAAHLRSGLPHSRCSRRETAENLRRSRAGGRWGGLALVVLVVVLELAGLGPWLAIPIY